ncbi:MAG: hypothetical protein KAI66_05785 [Lentisphaeria bacterium]|nr:hypothetical protein [Lentisphaeria bacterium]
MIEVKKMAAQGDVLFRRVESLPEGYEKSDDKVIAHSETGHNHVVVGNVDVFRNPDDPMIAYLIVKGDAQIEHKRGWDTHETLRLKGEPKGEVIWEIRRQREHTPEGWRRVED